jgi:hypothetical protein
MCRFCLGIAGIVLSFAFVGCGDESDEGPKTYRGSAETEGVAKLRDQMSESMKSGKYVQRPTETKPATTKSLEKKN